jgi:signal transduction histidine kinase
LRRVVHEIRNHLAVAIANIEAFRDGVFEPSPKRLAAVLQALGEVEVLLGELSPGRAISQPTLTTQPRTINVCDVITNEVLAFEAAAVEREIDFRVQHCVTHDAACTNFTGDPVRVAEIVNNVVSNALRYTPPGGRVEVDCRRGADVLVLTVTDSGPGVRNDEAAQIFEPGFRGEAAAQTEGSGLGLTLVKRFVEELGGTIAVDNLADCGARFTVRLPGAAGYRPQTGDDGTISLL